MGSRLFLLTIGCALSRLAWFPAARPRMPADAAMRLPGGARGDKLVDVGMSTDSKSRSFGVAPWCGLVLAFVAIRSILTLRSPFWLDETVGYWMTNGGISQIPFRATNFPHSMLYATLLLAIRSLGAASEWVYRLPSILAVALSVGLLFRMSRRLFGSEIAWIIVAVFASIPTVSFAACDARPYGLGLLAAVLATDLLLRFLDRPSYRLAVLYGLAAAVMVHFHILFGAALIFHFLYFVYYSIRCRRIRIRYSAVAGLVIFALALPLAKQYLLGGQTAGVHSFAERPRSDDLAIAYFPTHAALALLLGLAAAALSLSKIQIGSPEKQGPYAALAVLWALTPPAVLYAVSKVSPAQIFIPRYFLTYAPGLAMCFGLFLGSIQPRIAGRVSVFGLALIAAALTSRPSMFRHTASLNNWGPALALVEKETAADKAPVLIRSSFPESNFPNFFPLTPIEDNVLFCQLSFYPTTARLIPMQLAFGEPQMARLDNLLQTALQPHRFLLMSQDPVVPTLNYLRGRLGPAWQLRELGNFDGLVVEEFKPGS